MKNDVVSGDQSGERWRDDRGVHDVNQPGQLSDDDRSAGHRLGSNGQLYILWVLGVLVPEAWIPLNSFLEAWITLVFNPKAWIALH